MAIETNLNKRIVTGEDIDVTVTLTTTAKKVYPAINELKASIDSKEAKFGDGTETTTQTGAGYSKTELDKTKLLDILGYEEKTITIPAVYGWKTITPTSYNWTDSDIGKKIKTKLLSRGISDMLVSGIIEKSLGSDTYAGTEQNYYFDSFALSQKSNSGATTYTYCSTLFPKLGKIEAYSLGSSSEPTKSEDKSFYKWSETQLWDIITPAQTITILVKK